MGDFIKRVLISYGLFTGALWVISFWMMDNGSAHPQNPVWVMITNLRNTLTWIAVTGAGVPAIAFVLVLVISALSDAKTKKREREGAAKRHLQEEREREERYAKQAFKEELNRKQALLETQRREEEHRQEAQRKLIAKQRRSTVDAVISALDDF